MKQQEDYCLGWFTDSAGLFHELIFFFLLQMYDIDNYKSYSYAV